MRTLFVSPTQATQLTIAFETVSCSAGHLLPIVLQDLRDEASSESSIATRDLVICHGVSPLCKARLMSDFPIFESDKENKVSLMRYVITTKYASP
jgi:hypothetical protein